MHQAWARWKPSFNAVSYFDFRISKEMTDRDRVAVVFD